MKREENRWKRRSLIATYSSEKRRRDGEDETRLGEAVKWKRIKIRLRLEDEECREVHKER